MGDDGKWKKDHNGELATLMQCHESQQSAAIIATIAIIIGKEINTEAMDIDERYRRAIGDVILWDTPVITTKIPGLQDRSIRFCKYLKILKDA